MAQDEGDTSVQVKAAPVGQALDVLRLKSGAVFKGRISEHTPGDRVVFVTLAGDIKTIPDCEVAFVGPAETFNANKAPAPAPQDPPADSTTEAAEPTAPVLWLEEQRDQVVLEFLKSERSASQTLKLWKAEELKLDPPSQDDTYTGGSPLCTLPCKVRVPVGSHLLGLSNGNGKMKASNVRLDVQQDGQYRARFKDNSGARVGGLLLFLSSLVAGAAVARSGSEPDEGNALAGGIVAGVGALVSLFMMVTPDEAVFSPVAAP